MLLALVVIALVVAVMVLIPRKDHTPDVRALTPEQACEAARRGETFHVRTSFRLPLIATTDSRVWEYRAGWPAKHFPVLMRIEFEQDQTFGNRIVIAGEVTGVDRGVVIVSRARLVPE